MSQKLMGLLLLVAICLVSPGTIADSSPCYYDDPSLLCAMYCNNLDGFCWGPGQASQACIDSGYGCIGTEENDCCAAGGGF